MLRKTLSIRRSISVMAGAMKAKLDERGHHEHQEPCLCVEEKCKIAPGQCNPKVVIVGAGVAGLSAAERLIHCGIENLVLLESCDRLGGRVMSCWLGDAVVELGARGLQGATVANPMYNLAVLSGERELTPMKDPREVFITSEGRAISNYAAEELLFKYILGEAPALGKEKTSLLHFLSLRIQQELLHYDEVQRSSGSLCRYDGERVLFGLTNELRSYYGDDISKVSAPLSGIRKRMPGPNIDLPQGMVSLMLPLVQGVPYANVKISSEVKRIEWQMGTQETSKARVYTKENCYEADYVILTLPIGVLREKSCDLFFPALPQCKLEAFNKIGIGCQNNIFAEYAQPWWGAPHTNMRLAWSPCEITRQGEWTKGLGKIEGISRTVAMFSINGPEARMVEQFSEEEIAIELTRFVRKLTGDNSIPFPSHVIVTRWGSNEFCRGSIMYMGLDTTEDHLQELSLPVPNETEAETPVLLFAGDMSVPSYFGTLAAARMSGLREAERVIRLTKRFSGSPS